MKLRPITNGDVFERVATCASKKYPQPGDRYVVNNPFREIEETSTNLRATGRTLGPWNYIEFNDTLHNPAKWKRIDLDAVPSMLDVLAEELAVLAQSSKRLGA